MRETRKPWKSLVLLVVAVLTGLTLFLLAAFPALAAEFFYIFTTLQDFSRGAFYHTALSWTGDGEVRLLPIGLGQPWVPGNNTGLPPRAGLAAVYANGYLYTIAGDFTLGNAMTDVYYARVYTNVMTATGRLSDWQPTTPLPASIYPHGVWRHDAVALVFTDTQKTFLYVMGGGDSSSTPAIYNKVLYTEVLTDGVLGNWQETTPLPRAILGHESLVLSDTIYVLGGIDAGGGSRREVYYARPDRETGAIANWLQTTADLPTLGVGGGGYNQSSVALSEGRIYIYGGSSGVSEPSYSYYVHFAKPGVGGDITGWTYNNESLPLTCFASEGASHAGLLLAIAGAWSCGASGCTPEGRVMVSLIDENTGQTGAWYATDAMDPPRFYHAVAQDEGGFLYSIGGTTGASEDRLNNVDIALPYGGGGRLRIEEDLTGVLSATLYAPYGRYTSPYIDVRLIDEDWFHATLTSFSWNTTITDAGGMTVSMSYRYYDPIAGWTMWSEPVFSLPGVGVTKTIEFPPETSADRFQYRAYLSATTLPTANVALETPLLNAVRVGVLSPPDLKALTLTVACSTTCPSLIPVDQPVQIEFTAVNQGSNLPSNFYAAIFYTTTSGYVPTPPEVPPGCTNYPTVTCPLVLPQYAEDYGEGAPPFTMRTTYVFPVPGVYWLVAQVDYNNEPAHPTYFDIAETIETNNITRIPISVGFKLIYLPVITKGWQ